MVYFEIEELLMLSMCFLKVESIHQVLVAHAQKVTTRMVHSFPSFAPFHRPIIDLL